ncbi:E3 ubiquitin-protein ligase RBBP6 [Neocloeon triangulifer]|uniref:E3 ubiquitin-protein ligase RBBP6 n=1 Tax=Neocloeon triangulifer TaxID=2078957 RepID=UPI00286FABF7|nr:E3 ubiquitin-protein ligase RBBP6 [Neocloeon triangulifer]
MSVHYKFKSALDFDTVTFDGLHISVGEFKKSVCHQKRFGKTTDFDLQVTNAQTKEVYGDDLTLIPKNTSLIVARVPLTAHQKRIWAREAAASSQALNKATADDSQDQGHSRLVKTGDLSSVDASEEDKIKAMMKQATSDYDPSNYMRIKGSSQIGEVPGHYRCHRCHQSGHWIKNCPLTKEFGEPLAEVKKSTGIPRSFMVPVAGPLVPGAMITPTGSYAVPAIDHEAYQEQKKERPAFEEGECPVEVKPELPEDLVCSICEDLLTDAVMIPCCGNSFCDECIRSALLESEEHECPDCKDKGVSPDTLLPNRFLRNSVAKFRNDTGYSKPLRLPMLFPEHVKMQSPVKEEETKEETSPKLDPISRTPTPKSEEPPERERDMTPDSRLDERSRTPPRRRYREDTPTHDEPLLSMNPMPPSSTHLLERPVGPLMSYHAPPPPGVDDHYVPNYPPPGPPPQGPPPMAYGQGHRPPFRGQSGQYYGRREPEFNNYPYEGGRPFRQQRFDRPPLIEDPLDAFNRILREKDEQRRRRRERSFSPQRQMRRSRSPKARSPRSRSPKLRRSPPPLMGMKRKTPNKKYSRSRSRSPIMRRQRSRSFSMSPSPTRHMRPLALRPSRHSRSPPPHIRYADRPDKYMERPEKHMDKYMDRSDKYMDRGPKYLDRPDKYMERPDKFIDRPDKYLLERPDKYYEKPPEKYVDKYAVEKYPERHEKFVERPEKFVERHEKHSRSRAVEDHKPFKRHEKERVPPREVEEREVHREPESSERLHKEPEKFVVEKEETPKKDIEDFRTLLNIKKAKHDSSAKKSSPEPEEKKETKTKEKKKRRESVGSKKKKHKEKDKEKKKKSKTPKVSKGEDEEEKQQGEAPDTTTAEEEPKDEPEPVKEVAEPPKVEEKAEEPAKPEILPEPSKWEHSEEEQETSREEPAKCQEEEKSVTVEVLKRAENAIFKKAINAIRPERKVFLDAKAPEDIQVNITVEEPVVNKVEKVVKKAEKRKSTDEPETETSKKKKHKKEKKKRIKKKTSSSSSGSSSDSEEHKKKKKKKKKAKKKKHHSTEDSESSSEEEKKTKRKKKKKHKK